VQWWNEKQRVPEGGVTHRCELVCGPNPGVPKLLEPLTSAVPQERPLVARGEHVAAVTDVRLDDHSHRVAAER